MGITTEDGRNYLEEEGSCLGTVVSNAPFSRSRKISISSKSDDSKSSSRIRSKNSSSSNNRIYWASPKYWPYLAAAINNTRSPDLSKDNYPRFGDLMVETITRQTVKNALKRLGKKPITLENVFPILKRSLLSQEMVIFIQDIIGKSNEGNGSVLRKEKIQLIVDLCGACSDKQVENHLEYLISVGRLNKLNMNGRVVATQGKTT